MGQKKKSIADESHIPRVKKEKKCDRIDFLKSQKKKPSMPLDDLTDATFLKERRKQKREIKRERQRRKDVTLAADAHLEKCTDSLQRMDVEKTKC